ncbi:MAG TPA: hypothetical protein PLU81_12450 [Deltaproteobacteria bacterium]|nr:hypothetical protein [Deltaproteobacteria bacterium]HPR52595.1 hypothetical protein [Deltaproteobacteria bacterium]
MEGWKLPPKAKIYEALSAVADGRVSRTGANTAEVISSSGTKSYTVEWNDDVSAVTSNDNASYWQGYLGYPIMAVLMHLGRLAYDSTIALHLAGIPWKQINKQFKNDYDKAVGSVLTLLEEKGVNTQAIQDEADRIMSQTEQLSLGKLPRRKRPPKG